MISKAKNGNGNGQSVSLKTFIDARLDAQDKVFEIKLGEIANTLRDFETEFKLYKAELAAASTAAALAAGAKQGMTRIGSFGVTVLGVMASLLWATSMAVNIYIALHK